MDLLKNEVGQEFEEIWMIGDDVRDDVCGSLEAGFNALLVKTGKYRQGDEQQIAEDKRIVCENFADAVNYLINHFDSK